MSARSPVIDPDFYIWHYASIICTALDAGPNEWRSRQGPDHRGRTSRPHSQHCQMGPRCVVQTVIEIEHWAHVGGFARSNAGNWESFTLDNVLSDPPYPQLSTNLVSCEPGSGL